MLTGSSIVFLGNFNPAIFQPQWFDRYKILPIQETQWAEGQKTEKKEIKQGNEVFILEEIPDLQVTPVNAVLNFPSLRINATPAKFVCATQKRECFKLIHEVCHKIFILLNHTPVSAIGTNFDGLLKLSVPATVVLNRFFVRDAERLVSLIGGEYRAAAIITYTINDAQVTFKAEASKEDPNNIVLHANFHRNVKSLNVEGALSLLSNCYDNDLSYIIDIWLKLFGEVT